MKHISMLLLGIGLLAVIMYGGFRYLRPRAGVTVHDGKSQQDSANTVRLVNVLSNDLFVDAHIKGSINVPFEVFEETVKNWDKHATIVVYCANYACSASGAAAQMLRKLGFTKVFAYEGGTAEWYQLHQNDATYEIEGPARQDYLAIAVKQPQHAGGFDIISAEKLKELLRTK